MPSTFDHLARTLGLNLDGFELEAQDLWNKLENLASDNPLQYQQFISQTIIDNKSNTSTPEKKSFRPHVGFCIKTICLEGHGKKVMDCTDVGLPCYVNFCHHLAVDPATIGNSIAHQTDLHSGGDIAIPLAVGTVRELTATKESSSKDIVIDVVFHSDVIQASEQESFKTGLIQLGIRAILEDKGFKLDCNRVVQLPLSRGYMGLGVHGDTPVRFIVETRSTTQTQQQQQLNIASITKSLHTKSEVLPDINLLPVDSSVRLNAPTITEVSTPKITLLPETTISSNFHITSLQLNDYLTFKIKVYILTNLLINEHDNMILFVIIKLLNYTSILLYC